MTLAMLIFYIIPGLLLTTFVLYHAIIQAVHYSVNIGDILLLFIIVCACWIPIGNIAFLVLSSIEVIGHFFARYKSSITKVLEFTLFGPLKKQV